MTEKKLWTLKVDEEFKALIPPLSEEERSMLEDSILRDGCDTPLTVWEGIIVDGHNRYDICQAHGVPFAYEERQFEDRDAAMFWMLEHQLARRNLEPYQRAEMMLKYAPILRKDAAQRQATSTGGSVPQLRPNLAEAERRTITRDRLAKMAGVSHGTLDKVKKLEAEADEATKEKLRAGEISIHKAYTELVNKQHEGETRICECCGQGKPFSEFSIPSKSTEYRTICKDCEAKVKQAAKEAEIAASLPVPPEVSGIGIRDGKTAHISLGLPDDPAMFDQMLALLQHAQDAYIASFKSSIAQYRPSMISEEHTNLIAEMIDHVACVTEELLNDHLKEDIE